LQKIEQQTGVPESIMVAIWGNETNYGTVMGGFDLRARWRRLPMKAGGATCSPMSSSPRSR